MKRIVTVLLLATLLGCGNDSDPIEDLPPAEREAARQEQREEEAAEERREAEAPPNDTGVDWFIADTPWGRIPCLWAENSTTVGTGAGISCDWSQATYPPGGP